jgi:hypothetical protein
MMTADSAHYRHRPRAGIPTRLNCERGGGPAAQAQGAGVRLRLAEDGKVKVPASTPPELLDRLRIHKLELTALLRGDICRYCGEPMGWPQPAGVVLADGTALHHGCAQRFRVERIRRVAENAFSPGVMAEEAELAVRGEPI